MQVPDASITQRFGRTASPATRSKPRTVGALLEAIDAASVLHDRQVPGTKAAIQHIVVTSGGVWVVACEQFEGSIGIRGGLFRLSDRLISGGCDRTALVDAVLSHTSDVRAHAAAVLHEFGMDVSGALCFTGAEWGWLQGSFSVRDVLIAKPKHLAKLFARPDKLQPNRVRLLGRELAALLPPA